MFMIANRQDSSTQLCSVRIRLTISNSINFHLYLPTYLQDWNTGTVASFDTSTQGFLTFKPRLLYIRLIRFVLTSTIHKWCI